MERASTTIRVSQNSEPPSIAIGRTAAKRILTRRRTSHYKVDMRSCLPQWERTVVDLTQNQRDDAVSDLVLALDPHVRLEMSCGQRDRGRVTRNRLDGMPIVRS